MAKGSSDKGSTGPSKRGPGGAASRAGAVGTTPRRRERRSGAGPVKKPFPVGFAAGVATLVLLLGGILGYAILNTGSGFSTTLEKADKKFPGLQVSKNLSFNHTAERVAYPNLATVAPDGGNHNPAWQGCQVYTEPIVNEHAVHSLEHGAVWITYRPDLPADQVTTLSTLVAGNTEHAMMSPYPGLAVPISLEAWGRRLLVQSANDPKVAEFVTTYAAGPQTREPGASCAQGGITQPGTVPFVQASDGAFVPGTASADKAVPYNGEIPKGTAGSAAPGSMVTPDPNVTDPAASAAPTAAPAAPAPTP
ncbi:MAG: hypothetical protein JWL64_2114 [Frankiales bacterium]|nr:hypothetical protein [Frankiales bacterium]